MAFDDTESGQATACSTVAADQLAAYINRIESLEEECKALGSDKSEVYKEAKAAGFDVKTMKALIRRRRMDRADRREADALLELYEAALEGANSRHGGSGESDDFLD